MHFPVRNWETKISNGDIPLNSFLAEPVSSSSSGIFSALHFSRTKPTICKSISCFWISVRVSDRGFLFASVFIGLKNLGGFLSYFLMGIVRLWTRDLSGATRTSMEWIGKLMSLFWVVIRQLAEIEAMVTVPSRIYLYAISIDLIFPFESAEAKWMSKGS